MQNDILFDNIYVGHSIEDADRLKAETFDIKHPIEKQEEAATTAKTSDKDTVKSPSDLKFMENPLHYVREKVDLFITIAKNNPIQAIKFVPEVAGGLAVLVLLVMITLIGLVGGGPATAAVSSTPQVVQQTVEKVKESAVEAKDQAIDAAASGIDKVQAEVQKRTTRSSTQP